MNVRSAISPELQYNAFGNRREFLKVYISGCYRNPGNTGNSGISGKGLLFFLATLSPAANGRPGARLELLIGVGRYRSLRSRARRHDPVNQPRHENRCPDAVA